MYMYLSVFVCLSVCMSVWSFCLFISTPISFLAHLSWKLKWAFLITCRPSSVCPSVNFSHFHLLLQNHWANFNQTWHKASLGEGDSSLLSKGPHPFPRRDNYEKVNQLRNQCYDIIIALNKCVYLYELVSQVSDVAKGPLVIIIIWNIINCYLNRRIIIENAINYPNVLNCFVFLTLSEKLISFLILYALYIKPTFAF